MTRLPAALFGVALAVWGQNLPPGPTPEILEQEVEAYRRVLMDFGGLTRYGSENAELKTRPDVVFFGDDITENWRPFFPGKPYLNRGITRQTAAQMLVRFRQDVLDLKPKVVVIQTGTNDIARVMGPVSEETIGDFVKTMVELAKAHGIKVVLASVTPVCDCFEKQTGRRSVPRILGLNGWLKRYAAASGSVYLDYYAALVEGRAFRREFTQDGFLPNEAGYTRMTELAERAVGEALGK